MLNVPWHVQNFLRSCCYLVTSIWQDVISEFFVNNCKNISFRYHKKHIIIYVCIGDYSYNDRAPYISPTCTRMCISCLKDAKKLAPVRIGTCMHILETVRTGTCIHIYLLRVSKISECSTIMPCLCSKDASHPCMHACHHHSQCSWRSYAPGRKYGSFQAICSSCKIKWKMYMVYCAWVLN